MPRVFTDGGLVYFSIPTKAMSRSTSMFGVETQSTPMVKRSSGLTRSARHTAMDSARNKRSASAKSSKKGRTKSGLRGGGTSAPEPRALGVEFSRSGGSEFLAISLDDGRVVLTPLAWYPVLERATTAERRVWELLQRGRGVSWPDLDVDLSVAGVLNGSPDSTRRARAMRPARAAYLRALSRLDRAGLLKAG